MFLISVCFRPSRSRENDNKPGIVFFRVARYGQNEPRIERSVNSDIKGADDGVLQAEREKIISQIRLLYCIIERREERGTPFTIDDVVNDFRDALFSSESMTDVIAKSRTDFPIRRDMVSIGREFRDCFKYLFSVRKNDKCAGLFDYIFSLAQLLKNERRSSQAKSFISLISSLKSFTEADEIIFSNITAEFVQEYYEWLKRKGIANSSQSFYLRTLRTVLNKAHEDELVDVSPDWFEKVDTRIYKSTENEGKSLDRDVLLKIENLDLTANDSLALARDMFMFGFYCEGMELIDISNLTIDNIKEGHLVYRRRQKGQEKSVVLGNQAKKIISRYIRNGQKYLFPLLEGSEAITFGAVSNYVRRYLTEIGNIVGYPKLTFSMNISTYKSFASGVSISEILLKYGNII